MNDENVSASAVQQPDDFCLISTLETLRVFSDPLRQQILEALLDGARTVKQIATVLDLSPTKLYYHINLLEEHGLIRVVDTRIVSGIIEKHYQPTARNFTIHRSLLSPGQKSGDESMEAVLDALIERTRTDIVNSIRVGLIDTSDDAPEHHKLALWRGLSRLSEAQATEFYARLGALVEEFELLKDDNDSEPAYRLFLGIFPTQVPRKPPQ